MEIDMILSYEEMVASVDKMIHAACKEEGVDYDEFIVALDAAMDKRYEDYLEEQADRAEYERGLEL